MLEGLRKNQKWVIFATAIVFILGMAVMGVQSTFAPKPYVGKIYGKKILVSDYDKQLKQYIQQYQQQNPDTNIDDQTIQRLSEEFWQRFVTQTVMDKQLKRYHIKVSDNDVLDKIKNNPPQELQYNPNFQTNGVFDKQKYMNLLTTNEEFAKNLEQYVRASLPYELLEAKVKKEAKVVDDSARIDYIAKNDFVSGKVINFDYNKLPEENVTDAEIKAYYEKNKEKEYKKEASCKLKFVRISVEPSQQDISQAKLDVDDIYKEVLAGKDFAELAKTYSQDPGSAQRGGDLGYFAQGAMIPEFDKVVFSLPVGSVSAPFKTMFGWHIVKVTGKKNNDKGQPEVQASHILVQIKASDKTRSDAKIKAEDLYTLADDQGIDKAAKQMNLKVELSPEFDKKAEYIPMIGRFPHLVTVAFKKRVGFVEKPLKLQDGFVVVEVAEKLGKHYDELANVKEAIKFNLSKEKRIAKAAAIANAFAKKATPDKYLAMAAAEGWSVVEFNNINVEGSLPEIGLNKDLNNALLKLNAGQTSGVIKTDKGSYIAVCTVRAKPDMNAWNRDKAKLIQDYRNQKENQYYSEWYRKVMEEAKVEDLRYLYY